MRPPGEIEQVSAPRRAAPVPWALAFGVMLLTLSAEASVPRAAANNVDELLGAVLVNTPLVALPPTPERPSQPALFAGDELARALHPLQERTPASRFALGLDAEDLAGSLDATGAALASGAQELRLDPHRELELLVTEPLRGPPDACDDLHQGPEPCLSGTRIGGLELEEPFRIGGQRRLSLDLRWACEADSCRLTAGKPLDPWGLESFGEFVSEYTESAFANGGFWSKTAATGLNLVDAAFQVASVGATKKIDKAQEQLDRGEITRGQYWKKTAVAAAQTAATYAGGAAAGTLGARAGVRLLGSRGVTALGVRTAGAIGGAAGGIGGTAGGDVVGVVAGEQEGPSSLETYATAAVVGAGIGAAGAIPKRTPQDVNANPQAPAARPLNRPVGRPSHNAALRQDVRTAQAAGAADFRVNQQQLTASTPQGPGARVGTNRPDLQYTDAAGRRTFVEYDAPPADRSVPHALRLLANDPSSIVFLRILP